MYITIIVGVTAILMFLSMARRLIVDTKKDYLWFNELATATVMVGQKTATITPNTNHRYKNTTHLIIWVGCFILFNDMVPSYLEQEKLIDTTLGVFISVLSTIIYYTSALTLFLGGTFVMITGHSFFTNKITLIKPFNPNRFVFIASGIVTLSYLIDILIFVVAWCFAYLSITAG